MHYHFKRLNILFCAIFSMAIAGFMFLFAPTAYADTFPFLGTLHAGNRPEAMAVNTQTHMLYIAYESPGVVVGFNPLQGSVNWRAMLGDVATDVQVDSTSNRVFVASASYQQHTTSLSVLDGATGHVLFTAAVGSGDNGISFDAQRNRVYVTCSDAGIVDVFTFGSGWQGTTISNVQMTQLHLGPHPQGVAVNSRMGRLYVADLTRNVITVLDETSMKTLATIAVGVTPLQPLRVDEATGRVYVVCSTSQELDIIDGRINSVLGRVPVGPYPEGLAIHSATGRIYVADEGSKELGGGPQDSGTTITAIDEHTFSSLGTLQVGQAPDGLATDPVLHRLYVATEQSNAVVEISDSAAIPLTAGSTTDQVIAARQTITLLQQATMVTLIVMLLTFSGATLSALLPRWRARGNPQTLPIAAPSHSEEHSLPR